MTKFVSYSFGLIALLLPALTFGANQKIADELKRAGYSGAFDLNSDAQVNDCAMYGASFYSDLKLRIRFDADQLVVDENFGSCEVEQVAEVTSINKGTIVLKPTSASLKNCKVSDIKRNSTGSTSWDFRNTVFKFAEIRPQGSYLLISFGASDCYAFQRPR